MCFLNKKYYKKLDLKKRFYYKKNQYFTLIFKTLIESSFDKYNFTTTKLSFFLMPNKIKNHCILTRRSSSIFFRFKLSRLKFRYYALNGRLVGIKKSV